MTNPYYTFAPSLIPGTRARSEEINTQYTAIEQAFDLLPTPPDALLTGRATLGVDTGSGDAYLVTMTDTRTVNQNGDEVVFRATHDNDGPSTLQVDGIAPVPLVRYNGNALQAGDIVTGAWYDARFSSATGEFYIISPAQSTNVGTLTYGPPTHLVGLVASEGIAPSVLRSDAGLAIDTTISPRWTGNHSFEGLFTVDGDAIFNGTTTFNGAIFGGTIASSTLAPDGSVSAPSIAFAADTDTGFYRIGSNNIGLTTGGVLRLNVSATAITAALPIYGSATGTASTPSFAVDGDPNTGMFSHGPDDLGFTVGGTMRFEITTLGIIGNLPHRGVSGAVSVPTYTFTTDNDTGMYNPAAGQLGFAVNGANALVLVSTGAAFTPPVQGAAGSATTPTFGFSADTNTGMYSVGSDDLGFATGGVLRLDISTTAITSTLVLRGAAGSVAAPAYSFSGDTNTGMYSAGTDTLNFATGGVLGMTIGATRAVTMVNGLTISAGGIAVTGTSTVGGQTIAVLASPAFTGNPTAPTQTAGNNSTRLATTAFVTAAVTANVPDQLSTASGSAPSYSARAFARFYWSGSAVVISSSGNIASITRSVAPGYPVYTVTFSVAMASGNYTVVYGSMLDGVSLYTMAEGAQGSSPSSAGFAIELINSGGAIDPISTRPVSFAVFI